MFTVPKPKKKCPFCGDNAEVTFSGHQGQEWWNGYILAKCNRCGSSGKSFYYKGWYENDTNKINALIRKAADAWDTRYCREAERKSKRISEENKDLGGTKK